MSTEKVHEDRLRRMADRQGLRLMKSRRRDPRALDYGGYQLVNARSGGLIHADPVGRGYNLDLDEVERLLTEGGKRPAPVAG